MLEYRKAPQSRSLDNGHIQDDEAIVGSIDAGLCRQQLGAQRISPAILERLLCLTIHHPHLYSIGRSDPRPIPFSLQILPFLSILLS